MMPILSVGDDGAIGAAQLQLVRGLTSSVCRRNDVGVAYRIEPEFSASHASPPRQPAATGMSRSPSSFGCSPPAPESVVR